MAEYRKLQHVLGLERVIVVQPTSYGTDNRCTLEAIADFGGNARGVAAIDDTNSDAEIERLTAGGMRLPRAYLRRAGCPAPELAGRIHASSRCRMMM